MVNLDIPQPVSQPLSILEKSPTETPGVNYHHKLVQVAHKYRLHYESVKFQQSLASDKPNETLFFYQSEKSNTGI